MNLNIEKFDPNVEKLNQLIVETQSITLTDFEDPKQLRTVKENRIKLKNARVAITKTGKELRDDALQFQRAVIAKEKELVAIIEPEEERLKQLEADAQRIKDRKEREALIPERRERLATIGDGVEVSDEQLLDMDGPTFEGYFNQRQAEQMEKEREELEERERKLREEEEARKREAEAKEREERARQEERERIEREARHREEDAQRQKEQEEAAKKAEQERIERDKKYQSWLMENGYSENSNFRLIDEGKEIKLYKLVSTFTK